jgi:hypothetical protein
MRDEGKKLPNYRTLCYCMPVILGGPRILHYRMKLAFVSVRKCFPISFGFVAQSVSTNSKDNIAPCWRYSIFAHSSNADIYDANELYTEYYIYALFTINYIMVLILAPFRGSPLEGSRLPTLYEHTLTLRNR